MEIKASYAAALYVLIYFAVGMFIIYYFRKRHTGRFSGQGYKFPAIIYFIGLPIIVAIGRNFKYDLNAVYSFFTLDQQFIILIFVYGVFPTLVYIGIGLYILSLEHHKSPLTGKKREGYRLPALIYFISVPTLIVIAISMHFAMNYISGRFENQYGPKPAGYQIYKFLVLKDIIPRSGTSLDEKETAEDSKNYSVKVEYKSERVKNNESKETESSQTVEKTDEKYYALVIGNNNYEHFEKLDAAANDAKVIANVLQNKYGFEVELLLNGDYRTTINSIYNMTDKLKENDNLLIYYAGHGELDTKEKRGYWLPVDAMPRKKSTAEWITNSIIADRIKATKAKHVLLMVDSCFSGTLTKMRSGGDLNIEKIIDEKYIERLKVKKTRLVITSGGNEPVVDSEDGQHSLFALKLIDTLKNNDNVINSHILFENIRRYVIANAKQTPAIGIIFEAGHDDGDFLFFAKN